MKHAPTLAWLALCLITAAHVAAWGYLVAPVPPSPPPAEWPVCKHNLAVGEQAAGSDVTAPRQLTAASDRAPFKRPCSECLLSHRWGACKTNESK